MNVDRFHLGCRPSIEGDPANTALEAKQLLGLVLATGHAEYSVRQHLELVPTDWRELGEGEAEIPRLPMGTPENPVRVAQRTGRLLDRLEECILVTGLIVDPSSNNDPAIRNVVLDSGDWTPLYGQIPLEPGHRSWVLFDHYLAAFDGRDHLIQSLDYVEPFQGPIVLPNYGGPNAADYAQSRLCRELIDLVAWPQQTGLVAVDALPEALRMLHAPHSMDALSNSIETGLVERVVDGMAQLSALIPTMPTPRMLKSAIEAEAYAAEVMRSIGFEDARVTPPGADGGLDVTSFDAVAQVKMEAVPTGRPVLQALVGAAFAEQKAALFFSLAGYSAQALEWAERVDLALFEFAFDGSIAPRSSAAVRLLAGNRQDSTSES